MITKISLAENEWAEIEKKAEALYPGKGVTYMITMELSRHMKKQVGPCQPISESPEMYPRPYRVPEDMLPTIKCICRNKKISVSSFIARVVLYKHLD